MTFNILDYFKYCIVTGRPFSYTRMGDGEIACMRGDSGNNCDGSEYSHALGEDLFNAYRYLGAHRTFIAPHKTIEESPFTGEVYKEIMSAEDFHALYRHWEDIWGYAPWVNQGIGHRVDYPVEPVIEFWKTVIASNRKKVLIGSPALGKLKADLGCAAMYVTHPSEAYKGWVDAANVACAALGDDGILILCCGMTAKVIMANVLARKTRVTAIDAGSAWDSLYTGQTRTGQLLGRSFKDLYG